MLIQRGNAQVELFLRHDQRRRNDEVAHPGLIETPCAIIFAAI
jgi:hypothetical protein